MKDAMDTYFEEKWERDRQRIIKQSVERRQNKKDPNASEEFFLLFVVFIGIMGIFFIDIAFQLFTERTGLHWTALLIAENFLEYCETGYGFVILAGLLRLILVPIFIVMVEKKAYGTLFYALLWLELLVISINFFSAWIQDHQFDASMISMGIQCYFIVYYYRRRKRLLTLRAAELKQHNEEEGLS